MKVAAEDFSFGCKFEGNHYLADGLTHRHNQLLVNKKQIAVHFSSICGEIEDGWIHFVFKHYCVFVVIFLEFEHGCIVVETAIEFAEDSITDFDPLFWFLEEIRPNFNHFLNVSVL